MIKLKYNANSDTVDMFRDKQIMVSFSDAEFGDLVRGVQYIIREANPYVKRKQERKLERRRLINSLKILLAIRAINFWRKLKALFSSR